MHNTSHTPAQRTHCACIVYVGVSHAIDSSPSFFFFCQWTNKKSIASIVELPNKKLHKYVVFVVRLVFFFFFQRIVVCLFSRMDYCIVTWFYYIERLIDKKTIMRSFKHIDIGQKSMQVKCSVELHFLSWIE